MKLEVGSGHNPHPGYTHLDLNPNAPCVDIVADARKIPLDDNSVEELVAYHILEHFMWHDCVPVLKEWYRVLKPGGVIKLSMPNLDNILKVYALQDDSWKQRRDLNIDTQPYNASTDKWELINHLLFATGSKFNQHHACYNYEALETRLVQVGFRNVRNLHPDFIHLIVEANK